MTQLDYYRDGVQGVDLGVIGEAQYALNFVGGAAGEVFRRPASQVGTYGGWRWECSSAHPARYPNDALLAELAARIAAAIATFSLAEA